MEKKILLSLDQKVHDNITILAARNQRSVNEEMAIALKAWGDVGLKHDIADITDIEIPASFGMGTCQTCYRSTHVSEPCSRCGAMLCAVCYRKDHCLICDVQGREIPF